MVRFHPFLEMVRRQPHFREVRSLSALSLVLDGYELALAFHHIKAEDVLPGDFTEWVRCRLRKYNRAKGWRLLILEATGSEEAALATFFQLLDEHTKRQPHIVARLVGFERRYTFAPAGKQPMERVERYPDISLVTYTEDPGFFAVRDKPSRRDRRFIRDPFYPSLRSFEEEEVPRAALTVLDQVRFDRFLQEAEPGAAPNSGPAAPLGSSGVAGGPPSVS